MEDIGCLLFAIGLWLCIIFVWFYGMWKPYSKKEKLSYSEFIISIFLIGGSVFASGSGCTIILLATNPSPVGREALVSLSPACLCIYPLFIVSIFAFGMMFKGYIQRPSDKNNGDRVNDR